MNEQAMVTMVNLTRPRGRRGIVSEVPDVMCTRKGRSVTISVCKEIYEQLNVQPGARMSYMIFATGEFCIFEDNKHVCRSFKSRSLRRGKHLVFIATFTQEQIDTLFPDGATVFTPLATKVDIGSDLAIIVLWFKQPPETGPDLRADRPKLDDEVLSAGGDVGPNSSNVPEEPQDQGDVKLEEAS